MLYPDRCLYCGMLIDKDKRICEECTRTLPLITGEVCNRCGLELVNCNCKTGDFAFVSNTAPYRYTGPAKTMLKRFKFHKITPLALPMSMDMVSAVRTRYPDIQFDCVTFVPITCFRYLSRKFNQSELLASQISKSLDIPLESLLRKKLGAKTQKRQDRNTRLRNIRGKFTVTSDVKGKSVLLVDDIMTTGATMSECARALRKAGAKQTFCVTYAITCKK